MKNVRSFYARDESDHETRYITSQVFSFLIFSMFRGYSTVLYDNSSISSLIAMNGNGVQAYKALRKLLLCLSSLQNAYEYFARSGGNLLILSHLILFTRRVRTNLFSRLAWLHYTCKSANLRSRLWRQLLRLTTNFLYPYLGFVFKIFYRCQIIKKEGRRKDARVSTLVRSVLIYIAKIK